MMSTLLFRFRDLSVASGMTIQLHNEIIEKQDFVWWGWWGKHGEIPPASALAQIRRGQFIFFFDTGRNLFYKATYECCHHEHGISISTPDKVSTPGYYNEIQLKLWLKLTSITEVNTQDIIGSFSYQELSDLYEDEIDSYTDFFDKRIFSERELRNQDRTIWKIRPTTLGDKSHEILLTQKEKYSYEDFPTSYVTCAGTKVLWLSDIHFCPNGLNKHTFSHDSHSERKTLFQAIDSLLDRLVADKNKIEAIIVSGDFTYTAESDQFKYAETLLRDICAKYSINIYFSGITPGNHDFGFYNPATDASEYNIPLTTGQELSSVIEARRAPYGDFYKNLFGKECENKFFAIGRRFIFGLCQPVEFVFINSTHIQQHGGSYQGHAFIGDEQLTLLKEKMGWSPVRGKPKQVIRIAVMHHHLLPVSYTDTPCLNGSYSTILDGERLAKWLSEHEVEYLLHGHMHQNFYSKITRPVHTNKKVDSNNPLREINVLSLGSSGVKVEYTAHGSRGNYVCIIDFSAGKPSFSYYTLSEAGDFQLAPELIIEDMA
ncbi:metallophosphoesterase family protein [Aeromonas veronii]|uniref:metallophosphoesterase family protein n=2 Tax=Aeromonas veronii TaxID=654 RepID=UPI003BF91B49